MSSSEFDKKVNDLLHTINYAMDDFANAEQEFYKAKKTFHDKWIDIKEKMQLAKKEILELISIKGKEDDKNGGGNDN